MAYQQERQLIEKYSNALLEIKALFDAAEEAKPLADRQAQLKDLVEKGEKALRDFSDQATVEQTGIGQQLEEFKDQANKATTALYEEKRKAEASKAQVLADIERAAKELQAQLDKTIHEREKHLAAVEDRIAKAEKKLAELKGV